MKQISKYFFVLVFIAFTSTSAVVLASDDYPAWSFKGFGSIGLARSDNDTIGFYADRTKTQEVKKSFEVASDSHLGLQLDVDINDSWHITTQFIVRDHAGDFGKENLDWAFLKWNPGNDYEVRAGRMGLDLYLLSDYKYVGYAYPWIRPPHEFYANNPIDHYDGLDIKKTLFLDSGDLAFKIFGGYASTKLSDINVGLDLEGPAVGGNIVYQSGDWRFRVGYTHFWQVEEIDIKRIVELRKTLADPNNNFLIPGLDQRIPQTFIEGSRLHFMSLGTAYDDGSWLVHTEASFLKSIGQETYNPDIASAYLSIGRRVADVTVFARYGIIQTFEKKLRPLNINPLLVGSPFEQQAQAASQALTTPFNSQSIDQQSLSLGFRWDFYPKLAFKAEWSHFWLGEQGASLWERDANGEKTPNHVNLVSFGFDFIF